MNKVKHIVVTSAGFEDTAIKSYLKLFPPALFATEIVGSKMNLDGTDTVTITFVRNLTGINGESAIP